MNYVKAFLDLVITGLNYFPGWKTKIGAVLQVLGTVFVVYNQYGAGLVGFEVPGDIVAAVNTAAVTILAVGVANAPANNAPKA